VLTLLMLTQEAFAGTFERNAFKLITSNIKRAQLELSNNVTLPPDGFEMDTSTHDDPTSDEAVWTPVRYVKTYIESLQALAPHASLLETQACINYNAFVGGSFVLSWQLHHGKAAKRGHGPIRFIAELHQPLATTTILLWLFHNEKTVISHANGTVDFR